MLQIAVRNITYPSSIDPELTDLRAKVAYPVGAVNLPVLVVMHGWRESVADFDEAAVRRFARGQWLELGGVSGEFAAGESVRGGRSGVRATVVAAVNSPSMARMTTGMADGDFRAGETVTGVSSGATARVEDVIMTETFAIFVEMRGRSGSPGVPDGGGREIQDIVDAVRHVLAAFPAETDATQLHAVGYSGGGGNVFLLGARFPDFFNSLTAHFGISDYGYDKDDGWYFNGANPPQRALLDQWIGDPVRERSRYEARKAVPAITNARSVVRLYHDAEDRSTPVVFSQEVAAALSEAGKSNHALTVTTAEDNPRAIHGLPNIGNPTTLFEPEWLADISAKVHPEVMIPAAGRLKIAGWLETKRLTVWLGDGTSGTGEVVYDSESGITAVES